MKKINLIGVSYDEVTAEAKRLYNAAESGWIELCIYLRAIENSRIWKSGHKKFVRFGDYIDDTFPAAFGERAYRIRIALIEDRGEKWVRDSGLSPNAASSAMHDGLLSDKKKKEKFDAAVEDHIKTHGVAPSVPLVRRIVKGLVGSPMRESRRTICIDENHALRNQLASVTKERDGLASKLASVTKERDGLAKQVKKLTKRLKDL